MTQIDTSRRGFLKSAVAASAAMMSAVHAGIPAKSVAKYDETFDVVIIGSGFAGMACALKAGRAGLKVLMIEKMSTVGGNSAICGGNVACPVNPVQKAQGIKDSKELFIADCLKDGLGINHTNLLSTIADRCNDTIQMVVDCGCEFVPNKMLFEGGHSVPRSYEIKAGTGSGYIRPMHEELKKLKNVVIRTRCKFDDFVMEEDGSVAGIVCRTGYRFNNKAVSDDLENKTGKKSVIRATSKSHEGRHARRRWLLPRHLLPSDPGPARRPDDRLHEPARRHGRRADQGPWHWRRSGSALLAPVPAVLQPA